MMCPECGTSLIDGIGLGFPKVVGSVDIVGATSGRACALPAGAACVLLGGHRPAALWAAPERARLRCPGD